MWLQLNRPRSDLVVGGALIAAALALPGCCPAARTRRAAPDQGILALRTSITVTGSPAPSGCRSAARRFYVLSPSPSADGRRIRWSTMRCRAHRRFIFNTLSGASGLGVTDYRTAGDVKVTQLFRRPVDRCRRRVSRPSAITFRARHPLESATWTADRNRTYALGFGGTATVIDSANGLALTSSARRCEYLVGITQVLRPMRPSNRRLHGRDGHGYYSDPYKLLDFRPDHRRIFAWLTRYNQYFPRLRRDAAPRLPLPARLVRRPARTCWRRVDTAAAGGFG